MFSNLYYAEGEHEESKRQVDEFLLEQTIRDARAERTQALIQGVSLLRDDFVTLLSLPIGLLRHCQVVWLYCRTLLAHS